MMIQVILLTTALWSQAASQTVDRWTISAMDACPWSVVATLRTMFSVADWQTFETRLSARLGPGGVDGLRKLERSTAFDELAERGPGAGIGARYEARMREFERSTAGSRRGGHGNVRQRRQQRTARGTLWSTQASRRPWRQTSDE